MSNVTDIAKLSQIAHCYAQGKIGSGFDVSAACYGSHVYQRFPSHLLQELLLQLDQTNNGDDNSKNTTTTAASETLQQIMQMTWMGGVQAGLHCFHSNSLLQVIMADVSGGSESPSMAKQVLRWKQEQQQTSSQSKIPHWEDLILINQTIVDLLQELESMTSTTAQSNDAVTWQQQKQWLIQNADRWPDVPEIENPLPRVLLQLRDAFHKARYHLKHMGIAANQVPIEPDVQTDLCDACQTIPGVIAALVPGAGGYDAVVVVYIHDESVRNAIANLWMQWKPKSHAPEGDTVVGPLTVRGANYGDGVRIEPRFPMPL
jgi:phosphomevalonate kinase